MFNPPVANYVSFFYALGNTPAVNLVRDLPQGSDADILLLGCGDVRNILYTAYALGGLPPCRLDVTCCDIHPEIIARNVFFFSLLSEEHAIETHTAWSVYYELYLGHDAASLVKYHVAKILEASESSASWRQSRYGELLSFCDGGTLRLVRECWLKMGSVAADPEAKATYGSELQRTKDLKKLAVGDGVTVPSLRSAAPVALQAIQSIRDTNERFWNDGTLIQSLADTPNPLFHHALSENMVLHYGTDPLLGYHLATAFVSLAPASPLKPQPSGGDTSSPDIVAAALAQFEEWVAAFRRLSKKGLRVRFVVSDALAFCHTLQSKAAIDDVSVNIYRRQFDMSTCDLDLEEYGVQGNAPRLFDVIDTSNLADHFGLLNYLVAAKPLLKDVASSAIYTETLLASMNTGQAQLDTLLCGPGPTVSLLLGLSAVEYWTNATPISYAEEMAMTKAGHSRLSWKLNHHLADCAGQTGMVRVDPQSLAKILFSIYLGMFKHEKESLAPYTSPGQREKARGGSYPPFHRGSLATLAKLLETTVESEWTEACQSLISMIRNDETLSGGGAFMHELWVQLHLHGIYTESWLNEKMPGSCTFHSWEAVPEAVVLTLVVPREHFNKLYTETILKFNSPTLQLSVTSDHQIGSASLFQDVHVAFGVVKTHGSPDHQDFSVFVDEDDEGWNGSSPLVVSCYVPSSTLHSTPKSSRIGLRVQPNGSNLIVLRNTGIGPDFMVYETSLDDMSHAFITKYLPCTQGHPNMFRSPAQSPKLKSSNEQSWLSVSAAEDSGRVALITAHVDVTTDEGKKLLADKVPIQLRQSSPFHVDIVFGKNKLVMPLRFVVPVLKEGSNTRIARKSAYIEVIAPIAEPLDAEPLADFMYPMVLGPKSIPLTLNSHHLNLDMLPMLDVEPKNRKSNQFLTTFTSLQFSERERQLRDSEATAKAGISASLRLNFKETLFSIFMLASGLQGGQTGVFSLNHDKLGVVLLIIVRSIRLDLTAGSVVLDAAILPLTVSMVTSGELEEFLLVLRELQICSINVNDEELRLWRQAIPAFAERCRTWSHHHHNDDADDDDGGGGGGGGGGACEYTQPGATIPLTQETGKPFLCSCSHGTVPADFVRIPGWDVASRYAVRAAVGPTFATPLVEGILAAGVDDDGLAAGMVNLVTTAPPAPACRACGRTAEVVPGGRLMACSRCREVAYCSRECQKADWKKHRMECSTE